MMSGVSSPTSRRTAPRRLGRVLTTLVAAVTVFTFTAAPTTVRPARALGAPHVVVDTDSSRILGTNWQSNSQVVITIDVPSMSGTVNVTSLASTDGIGSFNANIGNQYHPRADDVVTVTDGVHTKTHRVMPLWAADSDETADTVTGLASPSVPISSWVFAVPNKDAYATADATGRWTVDYSGVWNLMAGTTVGFRAYDDDGDATQIRVTLPVDPDVDQDGVPNMTDNCPETANATQYDGDGDGVGTLCDDLDRVWGPDRYGTAAAIAEMAFDAADTVFLALGTNFPDALVAAAAGGYRDAPVLLINRGTLPPATIAELQRLTPTTAYIVGGTAVIDPVVDQLVGSIVPNVIRLAGPNR